MVNGSAQLPAVVPESVRLDLIGLRTRAVLAVLVAFLCVGCLPKIPHQRLSERAKVAISYVIDPGYSGGTFAPPEALKKAIAAELDDHNLETVEVPTRGFPPSA